MILKGVKQMEKENLRQTSLFEREIIPRNENFTVNTLSENHWEFWYKSTRLGTFGFGVFGGFVAYDNEKIFAIQKRHETDPIELIENEIKLLCSNQRKE